MARHAHSRQKSSCLKGEVRQVSVAANEIERLAAFGFDAEVAFAQMDCGVRAQEFANPATYFLIGQDWVTTPA